MNQKAVRHITPLRRAVESLIGIDRDLAWLQQQLVVLTATGLRSRFKRISTLIERGDGRVNAVSERMMSNHEAHGFGADSFASFLDEVSLQDTYLQNGAGAISYPVRVKRVARLIKRARSLTLGSSEIHWFLLSLDQALSKYLPEGLEVETWVDTVNIDEGDIIDTIKVKVFWTLKAQADDHGL